MKDVKEKYEKLRKKYQLPLFENLIREFPVKLDSPDLILHDIIEKMCEETSNRVQTLESIIFVGCSSEPSTLYETNMVKDKKDKLFEFYKELMIIRWRGEKVKNIAKEEEMANFVKTIHDEWTNKLKKKFIEICELFEKKWKDVKLREESTSLMYHG
ncbi:MAG: hypothetical protein NTW30_03960 [Candidatus Aenigmarchaeota archaeon]|nr:hypothetical protein [Candidatus Aenigmarchaeota archaeon]